MDNTIPNAFEVNDMADCSSVRFYLSEDKNRVLIESASNGNKIQSIIPKDQMLLLINFLGQINK